MFRNATSIEQKKQKKTAIVHLTCCFLYHSRKTFINCTEITALCPSPFLSPTGEEVLLIQEKLDGIKSRYAEISAGSSKALRTLEQALQLATRFASAHDDLNQWLDSVEAELNNAEADATPAYQERQKVGKLRLLSYLV